MRKIHLNNARVKKISKRLKKSLEETAHNQQEMWCQHPTKTTKQNFFFFFICRQNISTTFIFSSTFSSVLVASAQEDNVEALKEE